MKWRLFILVLLFIQFMNTGASAQKIAHINVEELINQLDEKK